jgi:hypothetical protein
MSRNTKMTRPAGRTERCVPLPADRLPDIATDPDMIRLKELLSKLKPDRRAEAVRYLIEGVDDDDVENSNRDHSEPDQG